MRTAFSAIVITIGLLAASCDGDDDSPQPTAPASPTTAAEPSATPSPANSQDVLTYVSEGTIWIADPPAAPVRFADVTPCGPFPVLNWSPDGERLVCNSAAAEWPAKLALWDAAGSLIVQQDLPGNPLGKQILWSPDASAFVLETFGSLTFFDRSGKQIEAVAPVGDVGFGAAIDLTSPLWSQSGNQFAFWAGNLSAAQAYDVNDAAASPLPITGRPLAWVLDDQAMLVAENYVPLPAGAGPGFPEYQVRLVYLDGRDDFQRRPELDDGRQFWLSPDRATLAFLELDLSVSLMDIATGEVTPIDGSQIGYPSEGIPPDLLRFTDDGRFLVWASDLPATIYRADVATGALSQLTTVPQLATISPDGLMLAYNVFDETTTQYTLYRSRADGSEAVVIQASDQLFGIAWRPRDD